MLRSIAINLAAVFVSAQSVMASSFTDALLGDVPPSSVHIENASALSVSQINNNLKDADVVVFADGHHVSDEVRRQLFAVVKESDFKFFGIEGYNFKDNGNLNDPDWLQEAGMSYDRKDGLGDFSGGDLLRAVHDQGIEILGVDDPYTVQRYNHYEIAPRQHINFFTAEIEKEMAKLENQNIADAIIPLAQIAKTSAENVSTKVANNFPNISDNDKRILDTIRKFFLARHRAYSEANTIFNEFVIKSRNEAIAESTADHIKNNEGRLAIWAGASHAEGVAEILKNKYGLKVATLAIVPIKKDLGLNYGEIRGTPTLFVVDTNKFPESEYISDMYVDGDGDGIIGYSVERFQLVKTDKSMPKMQP